MKHFTIDNATPVEKTTGKRHYGVILFEILHPEIQTLLLRYHHSNTPPVLICVETFLNSTYSRFLCIGQTHDTEVIISSFETPDD